MFYQLNKIASRTRTTEPSATDQSQANSTDINIILKGASFGNLEFGKGAAPAPVYNDYSNLPADFRDLIEMSRQLPGYVGQLPPQLRDIPLDVFMSMTPDDIRTRMAPPAPPPEDKKPEEEKK